MKNVVTQILMMMPIWFGIAFLGPVLAEIYLRTPVGAYLALDLTSAQVYAACMSFGGIYGLVAWRLGRWI